MKLLIIIPAYNEANNLSHVIEDIKTHCPHYDYLVVNDGSGDDTVALCSEQGYPLLDLPVNLGLAGAFQAGMIYAYENDYDAVVQFDGDGQHKAEYVPLLAKQLENNYDIVIGSRFIKERKPINFRMLGSFLISFAMRLTTGFSMCDPTSGMRIFNRDMIKLFAYDNNYTPEPDTISHLIRCNARVCEIPINTEERISGKSYLTFFRSIMYMAQISCSILLIQWFRKDDLKRKNIK